jgi:PAS domain S-box-containing protein
MGHMVFDRAGRYLRVNDAILAMNGGTREERVGRHIGDVQPVLGPPVLAAIQEVVSTGEPLLRQRLVGEVSASPGEQRVWRMTYYPVKMRRGELLGVGAICEDVTEAEQSARHVEVLGQATATLLRAVTTEEVVAATLGTVAPLLGAFAAAVFLNGVGTGSREPVVAHPAGLEASGEVSWERPPAALEALAEGAIAHGGPVLAPLQPEPWFPATPGSPHQGAVVVAPLFAPQGALGALALAYQEPKTLDRAERLLVAAVAEQCAIAVERAANLTIAEAAAGLTTRLQQATAGLAQALNEDHIAAVVIAAVRSGVGASGGGLGLVDHTRRSHRFVATFGWDQLALAGLLGERSLDEHSLSAVALRLGEPLYIGSPAELEGLMPPERARVVADAGRREAWVALPMFGAKGAIGTLAFSFAARRRFSDQERAFLGSLAGQTAAAIDRVRRHRADHQVAVVLQQALLPDRLPTVGGLASAARYLAGAEGVRVGGDWYDVFLLEGGEVALVIGDVAGHGLAAAGTMGHLRAQLRATAHSGVGPGQTVSQLDQLVHRFDEDLDQLTTLVYATWAPGAASVEIAVAGHLPPVLVDGDGARFVDSPVGPPLGTAQEPFGYLSSAFALSSSGPTTLVLYTDGLIERPGGDIREGLDKLLAVAASGAGFDPNDLADRLVAEFRPPAGWSDDVALLVCRFGSPAPDLARPV